MKKIIICLVIVVLQSVHAQDRKIKRAHFYFDKTYYSEAIPLYEKILEDTPVSVQEVSNLADAYYYIYDMNNASKWYRVLFANFESQVKPEQFYRYAHTLKALDNYEEANTLLRHYIMKSNNPEALVDFDKQLKILENVMAIGARFELKNALINTSDSEFGAVQNGTDIVFTANKKSNSWFRKIYKWGNENYLDLYTIPMNHWESGEGTIKSLSNKINTKLHESNAVFTKDGKTMYFTRNSTTYIKKENDKFKVSHLQIYKAEFKDSIWKNSVRLPFNIEGYSTEHPALSADEKTLYFASDRPGTLGSFDIFSVAIHEDGTFGKPQNLGDKINTKGKEQFPFMAKDNKLYFSSDGYLGFGGLDVFVSEIKNNTFTTPINVGLPLNSGYDDFAFYIDTETNKGFFSSNRPGGKGSDDIYDLKEIKPLLPEDCQQLIVGVVHDQTTQLPLEHVLVIVQDARHQEVARTYTIADGTFSFPVACEEKYTIVASKEAYTTDTKELQTNKERKKTNTVALAIKSHAQIEAERLLEKQIKEQKQREQEEQKKKEEQLAEKRKKEQEIQKKKEEQLAEKRKKEQEIQKKKEEALALQQEKEAQAKKQKERIDEAATKDTNFIKENNKVRIKTDPIYFDFNMSYLRRESKITLDKVIALMKKYPNMVIEIGTHTDNRGSHRYNMALSEKRAVAARTYLIEQGIAPERVTAKGYGATMPIIPCKSEKDCTEEDYEINRRCEFVLKNI